LTLPFFEFLDVSESPKNMPFHFSFPHYLLAKQSVDDRALNKDVLAALRLHLNAPASGLPLRVLEIGAGIGTMLRRLLRWQVLPAQTDYTLLDEMPENIVFARQWLPQAAADLGWSSAWQDESLLRLSGDSGRQVTVHLEQANVFTFAAAPQRQAAYGLLIAHAVLDLFPLPQSLPGLLALLQTQGLAWFTINFDGVSSLEPSLDAALDTLLEREYHRSMDTRPGGGDSQSGRHLFGYLNSLSVEILAAGASDWVVYPQRGQYPAEEAFFLNCILRFYEESLSTRASVPSQALQNWLKIRRGQVENGQLTYVAHQMDFLCRNGFSDAA